MTHLLDRLIRRDGYWEGRGVMNAASRLAFSHLKSFRREDGAPYDQYVWAYSRIYGMAMRAVHRCGRHWFRRRLGGRYCDWCGAHAAA